MAVRTKLGLVIVMAALVLAVARAQQSRAGEVDWPQQWAAFGPVEINASAGGWPARGHPDRDALLPGEALKSIPDELEIGGETFRGKTVELDGEGRIDLAELFGGAVRGNTVYLMASVEVDEDTAVRLGAGANWFMQWWLNGEPVYDTLATGNREAPVAPANHVIELPLRAGENILAAAVVSGSGGFSVAIGDPDAVFTRMMAEAREKQGRVMRLAADAELAQQALKGFRTAADIAGDDTERATALLALADALLADPGLKDRGEPREIFTRVTNLTGSGWGHARNLAAAYLGIAETYMADKDYASARQACEDALAAMDGIPLRGVIAWRPRARMTQARAYLREGDYDTARETIENLLADMDGPDEDETDGFRRMYETAVEQAQDMLGLIRLTELWHEDAGAGDIGETPDRRNPEEPPDMEWVVRNLRRDRPRMFITRDTLDRIENEGLTEQQEEWLKELKRRVELYPEPPELDDELIAHMLGEEGGRRYSPRKSPRVRSGDWAHYAAHAALVWLLTGEEEYRDRAVSFLEHTADCWNVIYKARRLVAERVYHRIHALSAYDWLYNDMTPEKREAIGRAMFPAARSFYDFWRQRRRGVVDIYTDTVQGWYLGMAFLGAGVAGAGDDVCIDILREGYRRHVWVFETHEGLGPDALYLHGAIGYANQNPDSEVNFLDTYRSALGDDFTRYFPKRPVGIVNYLLWNAIDPLGGRPNPLHYGWSDKYHKNNRMGSSSWLLRIPDLCAESGDTIDPKTLKAIVQAQIVPEGACTFLPWVPSMFKGGMGAQVTAASPLLMSDIVLSDEEIRSVLDRLPRARHFPDPIGQTFMNSGWGEEDTYALFIAGRQSQVRKHYDENHFTIYRQGFLAMDTGAQLARTDRSVPGDADRARMHQVNYYMDTIAHNCILIHMEGEEFPGFWGHKSTVNTGGMQRNHGAEVLAFETDEHYTYIASDATTCYHEDKSEEVVRQFLFVYPDYFVVFDRVESKTPGQTKTWLFHTQMEPKRKRDIFHADHREGRIFVKTLLPERARFEKIGGPGNEFRADGRNWPVNKHMSSRMYDEDGNPTPDRNVFGNWRMEISPASENRRDLFLHLLQAGDREGLKEMTPSSLVGNEQEAGVEFVAGERTVRAVFKKEDEVGGHIRITEGGKVIVDRPLTMEVQNQQGLALVE